MIAYAAFLKDFISNFERVAFRFKINYRLLCLSNLDLNQTNEKA